MQRLILVRHGETDWNRVGRYQGFVRTSLNERGRWQAERVACRLAGRNIDVVYASDLPRAMETAKPIADRIGLSVYEMEALREINVGRWEGLTVPQIQARHPVDWQAYLADPVHTARTGGESLAELAQRVMEAFSYWENKHPGGTVLAVTHSGPIQSLVCNVLGLPLPSRRQLKIDNASITVLICQNGRWCLETLNDTCHLEQSDGSRSEV